MMGEQGSYPKPGVVGGRVIRQVLSFFQEQSETKSRTISSHILIAISGGSDSVALGLLLTRYGRKVGDRKKMRLVHINHRWRGEESDADETFVRELARKWQVPITIVRLKPAAFSKKGKSLEEKARNARKKIFKRLSRKYGDAPVFTAHHADDLAETLIWRLLTGQAHTHGGGISFASGPERRPLLRVRKTVLRAFLKEEGQPWREDRTNHEGRLLRSRLRQEAMPALEAIFPKMVDRLVEQAFMAQKGMPRSESIDSAILFGAAGIALRKSHYKILQDIQERVASGKSLRGELNFEKGWRLKWETKLVKSAGSLRWILERT